MSTSGNCSNSKISVERTRIFASLVANFLRFLVLHETFRTDPARESRSMVIWKDTEPG